MKNITILIFSLSVTGFLFLGCSNTWKGVKQDTNEAYHGTKKAIHDATAE